MFIKHNLLSDTIILHTLCASLSGFTAVCIGSPVDVMKTRMMNAPPGTYKGFCSCANEIWSTSGLVGFYKGFIPNVVKIAAYNTIVLVSLE